MSVLERRHGQTYDTGFGGHTVLDMMARLSADPLPGNRSRFISHARDQQMAVERAWQDVVAGYVELKHISIGE